MKQLAERIKSILISKRGESLMESIAATLVFAILIAAVTMMLMVALRMTQASARDARRSQDAANAVAEHNAGGGVVTNIPADPKSVAFTFDGGADGEIVIPVIVYTHTGEGYTAFIPYP